MNRPETAAYLAKARLSLREASVLVANDLPEAAGRAAYLACYNAAQAYIFDATGRVAKSHNGVRSEFARLSRDDSGIDRTHPTFLARAYALKETADYFIAQEAAITCADARDAIEGARRFVEDLAERLDSP